MPIFRHADICTPITGYLSEHPYTVWKNIELEICEHFKMSQNVKHLHT